MIRNLTLIFLLSINTLWGSPVAPATAYSIANNWVQAHRSDRHMAALSSSISPATSYLFALKPSGWIMVAGDDTVEPILGYSFVSPYRADNLPPEFAYWRKKLHQTIDRAKLSSSTAALRQWKRLFLPALKQNTRLSASNTQEVLPLLKTTWGQGEYYNDWCPSDSASVYENGHDPVGCVATAMTQIMRYHQWPNKGKGEHAGIRFERETYAWSEMPESTLSDTNDAVAKISYHAGLAVDMMYGPNGSGAYPEAIANAMTNYFRYNVSGGLTASSSMSAAQWHATLQRDLDQGLPILYGGYDDRGYGGHAFVCDGYRMEDATVYYHFNWGWDGQMDGWFPIGSLNPGEDGYRFNTEAMAVLGIAPDRTVERPTITQLDATHLYMSRATGQWAGRGLTEGSGMTILGEHFGVTSGRVYFGSQHAKIQATVTSWSDTAITVNVPTGAQNRLYVVLSDGNTTSNTLQVTAWQRGSDTGCRHEGAGAIVYEQAIYAFGDTYRYACSEMYDPQTDTWTPIDDNESEKRWPGGTATLYGTKAYLFRGWMDIDDNRTRVFDLDTLTWSYAAPTPHKLRNGVGVVAQGTLYYLGGKASNEHNATTGVYAYDTSNDQWREDGNFTVPRAEFAAKTLDDKIYLFGRGVDDDFNATAEMYDPQEHTSSPITDMPLPMRTPGAATQGDAIVLLSGEVDNFLDDPLPRTPPTMFTYHPSKNTWETHPGSIHEPPVPFVHSQLLSVGDKLVSVGGYIKGSSDTDKYKQTWYLNPPNHPPSAPEKSQEKALTQGDDPVRIEAYSEDEVSDDDHDKLTLVITLPPHGGKAEVDGLEIVYTPDPTYHGLDTLRYRIQDTHLAMSANESTLMLRVVEPGGSSEKSEEKSTGGGCTYNPRSKGFDALMVWMLLVSLIYPFRRRIRLKMH